MKHVSYSLMMFLLLFTVASAQTTAESFEKLLPDMGADDMSVREKSQEAWQKICMEAGAPGKKELLDEVNRLMAAQLDKDVPLETKYWLLQQLQWTGDASVIPAIAKLLENKDLRIRDRAARALALNPAKEAEAALRTALESADGVRGKTIADALASRTPNLEVGTEKEMPAYFSEKDFDAAMKDFNGKSLEGKVRALTAVKTRKASKYLPDVLEAAKSDNQDLRYAALFALEKVGTAKELPLLLDMLFSFDRDKTEWVMTGIAAPGFDEALLQALGAEKDNGRFETLANLLSKRATREAKGPILNRAAADGVNNRVQLLAAAERIASKGDIPAFVKVALLIPPSRERDVAEQIVARLCEGDAEPVVKMMGPQNTAELLPMIGRIGGNAALEIIKDQLKMSENVNIAVRALCNWPNAVVADDLLAIAENARMSDQNKIAALRAFARVISLRDEEIGIRISGKNKVAKLRKGMGLATRVEEKRLILDRTAAVRDVDSIKFALEYIDDNDLQQNACRTIIDIAHHDNMRRPNKELFGPALDKVIERIKDNGQKERAQRYRANM